MEKAATDINSNVDKINEACGTHITEAFASKNGFAAMAAKYVEDGKTSVAWSFNATPSVDSWRADVVAPLTEYTERDGSWDDVEKAFVDQWAYYWNLSNEK